MNETKLPTILGIAIVLVGIFDGVVFVKNKQTFKVGAINDAKPKNVRISNITPESFTVSWTTDKKTIGFVEQSKNNFSTRSNAFDSFDRPDYIHNVVLRGLKPKTKYFFKINSDGSSFDNEGIVWQTTTAENIDVEPTSNIISGKVVKPNGLPVEGALVYVTVGGSSLISTTTESEGNWFVNISKARIRTLDSYVDIQDMDTPIEIFIQSGPSGIASAQVYPISAKPVPPIILGQTLNINNLDPGDFKDVPEAEINIPLEL